MRLVVAIVLAATALSATAACSKPAARSAPRAIYISVEKSGKISVSDREPADIQPANKVNP